MRKVEFYYHEYFIVLLSVEVLTKCSNVVSRVVLIILLLLCNENQVLLKLTCLICSQESTSFKLIPYFEGTTLHSGNVATTAVLHV